MYAGCNGLIRALVGEAWFVRLYFPFLCPFTVLCPSAVRLCGLCGELSG